MLISKYLGLYWVCVIIIFTDVGLRDHTSLETTGNLLATRNYDSLRTTPLRRVVSFVINRVANNGVINLTPQEQILSTCLKEKSEWLLE
jgi:hypothetical protein